MDRPTHAGCPNRSGKSLPCELLGFHHPARGTFNGLLRYLGQVKSLFDSAAADTLSWEAAVIYDDISGKRTARSSPTAVVHAVLSAGDVCEVDGRDPRERDEIVNGIARDEA